LIVTRRSEKFEPFARGGNDVYDHDCPSVRRCG
jgi:hypothetical protein